MSATYVITISIFIRRSQVFEFGSEWENHPIAAWVAVRYVLGSVQTVHKAHKVDAAPYMFSLLRMA